MKPLTLRLINLLEETPSFDLTIYVNSGFALSGKLFSLPFR